MAKSIKSLLKKGKLTGADVEFGRKLAEKLGVKPVFAETPRCGFDEHRPCAA